MEENEKLTAIKKIIQTKIIQYEYVILTLVLLGLAMQFTDFQYASLITVILLSLSATAYFISAFIIHEETNLVMEDHFFFKLIGIASGVVILGILFSVLSWPNAKPMTVVGGLTLLVSLFYILIQKNKRPELKLFSTAIILRIVILVAIATLIMVEHMKVVE